MTLDIEIRTGEGGEGWWRFELVKAAGGSPAPTPAPDPDPAPVPPATPSGEVTIVGDWTLLNAAGALGVGPAQGNISWWSNDEAAVTIRDCLFDDIFRFTEDGTFSNEMGDSTWLDTHQAPPETCGAPVAPHDNSSAATYDYDEGNGTLTVTGSGAHIGLSKVINLAEIASSADAPASIEYLVTDLTATTMTLDIEIRTGEGGEGWWRFELVKTP
jgi:hypothetical protein